MCKVDITISCITNFCQVSTLSHVFLPGKYYLFGYQAFFVFIIFLDWDIISLWSYIFFLYSEHRCCIDERFSHAYRRSNNFTGWASCIFFFLLKTSPWLYISSSFLIIIVFKESSHIWSYYALYNNVIVDKIDLKYRLMASFVKFTA